MGQRGLIEINAGACLAVAVMVLILPLWLFLSLIIAAAIHEMCHYLALKFAGVRVYRIIVGPFGANMETESMNPGRELACALAGPVGSLILLFLFRWIPGIALCGLFQGGFNLLPIYPMDGGRIFKCFLEILKIPHRDKLCKGIEWITVMEIMWLGFWGQRKWDLGWSGAVVGSILLLRIIRRNTSCKESRFGVQ